MKKSLRAGAMAKFSESSAESRHHSVVWLSLGLRSLQDRHLLDSGIILPAPDSHGKRLALSAAADGKAAEIVPHLLQRTHIASAV